MSNHRNRFMGNPDRLQENQVTSHKVLGDVRSCWGCGCDMLIDMSKRGRNAKICKDCQASKTPEEIRLVYRKHYADMRQMIRAKNCPIPPSEERFILNSPFRRAAA